MKIIEIMWGMATAACSLQQRQAVVYLVVKLNCLFYECAPALVCSLLWSSLKQHRGHLLVCVHPFMSASNHQPNIPDM